MRDKRARAVIWTHRSNSVSIEREITSGVIGAQSVTFSRRVSAMASSDGGAGWRAHISELVWYGLAWWVIAMVCGVPTAAMAQTSDGAATSEILLPPLQLQRFRPVTGPADLLNLYGSSVPGHLDWDAGFYLDIADAPLQIGTGGTGTSGVGAETVDYQTTLSLMGNIGLYDRFEVGLMVPITVAQASEELQPVLLNSPKFSTDDLPGSAINDTRVTGKVRILDIMEDALGLSAIVSLYIPLASNDAFTSDDHFSAEALVTADKFVIEGWGLRIVGNLGYRYRAGGYRVFRALDSISDEVLWGVGASLPLFFDRLDFLAEIDGAIGVAPGDSRGLSEGEVNAELRGAFRYKITDRWTLTAGLGGGLSNGIGTPDTRLIVGVGGYWVTGGEWGYDFDGDGIYGKRDKCPQQAEDFDGHEDFDGCPDYDNDGDGVRDLDDKCDNTPEGVEVGPDGCPDDDLDGDGIPNKYDKCPEDPEDIDGFEDGDGCPDVDNDKDGIPDTADDCPNQPETVNDFLDEDGCPDDPNEKVVISKDKIIITEPVYFATNKAAILPQSFEILDEVARVMSENPQIELVRVEGHTDDRGRDEYNLDLSQKRADSVRTYLLDKGISRNRLESVGYGEAQPIADNETADGRAKNRRVEFTIVEQ